MNSQVEIPNKRLQYKWSPEEDEVLRSFVNEYPDNITKAFELTADQLGLTYHRAKSRWYNHLSPKGKEKKKTTEQGNYDIPKKPKVEKVIENNEPEMSTGRKLIRDVKEQMDGFVDVLKKLQTENKMHINKINEQEKKINEQALTIKRLSQEHRELEEAYSYILKVMEKARKMFVEEERSQISYTTDNRGNIEVRKESSAG